MIEPGDYTEDELLVIANHRGAQIEYLKRVLGDILVECANVSAFEDAELREKLNTIYERAQAAL